MTTCYCRQCGEEKPWTAEYFIRQGEWISKVCKDCHRAESLARFNRGRPPSDPLKVMASRYAQSKRGSDLERQRRDELIAAVRLALDSQQEPRADGKQVAGDDGFRSCEGGQDRPRALVGQRRSAEGGPPTPAAAAKGVAA